MILSIDQGTTGTTAFVFDTRGTLIGRSYTELPNYYPRPGWVEQKADAIWWVTRRVCAAALERAGISASDLMAVGITNQRETTLLWDRQSGEPVSPAIVWQCRRSAGICDTLNVAGKAELLREKTGLVLDAYFSASKLLWLFRAQPELLARARCGELCFGTVDSWLIWKMTGNRDHFTDHSNASRTLLYNLDNKCWDPELLDLFGIPESLLPEIRPSAGHFADTDPEAFLGASVPICGVAGDQQASLFGQGCTNPGDVKNTYGTGCFMLAYAGPERPRQPEGLLATIACDPAGQPAYAVEGAVFTAGSAVQWLRDEMGLIQEAAETEMIAQSVPDTRGVYLVPAFSGLGAPHWRASARGTICGLTRGSGRAELVRATLESIAYQSDELARLMGEALGLPIRHMRVDGGASANNFLMQFQADISALRVERPKQIESTAVGAALLAGIGAGIWSADKLPPRLLDIERDFLPAMAEEERNRLLAGWRRAVAACCAF
ncbi:glycerol kinase GlpK [Microbulbifer thermotolerans]|uniref:glycerol kinase n=1 Tax=Microbulbifer thermotolerans TaxID=252514 RepID=A0AB35HZR7_MICTH|nr:glycerol kinase GlpK [Microbulbifer thermotolerans]MCX2784106.1 glycerol kinase GlpK [Microbulbifer thermotolerans]MCX2794875.1 glycerol kinase GlpK [Microbulbifer thermotolerans]MCX2803067.1 glycerol kinase GlpK [Microbulbifer thermotolerans]MCX2831063.1 glycerol kinase GlpK [Microbulbifer thermotolerans]MCX2835830.1 glycerol kinase GlpK [Microbulbifer thermotolerans]